MPNDPAPKTPKTYREKRRAAARANRENKARRKELMFQFVISGLDRASIATSLGVSLATVSREIDRALDARRLDTPDQFVRLQVARLNRAIAAINEELGDGNLAAIDPLLKVAEKLDRYHGVGALPAPPPVETARRLPSRAVPLALTHAAPQNALNVAEKGAQSLDFVTTPSEAGPVDAERGPLAPAGKPRP